MDPGLSRRFLDIAGSRGVDVRSRSVIPRDAGEVADVCRVCADTGTRIAVTSGPVARTAAPEGTVVLSLSKLAGITIAPDRMVVRAEAGATLGSMIAALTEAGLALGGVEPLPAAERHVGAVVATGLLPRRSLCGVEAVLATGERVATGGPMLRDATGYDLAGVLLGSAGRLALITGVTLRLRPAGAPDETDAGPAAWRRAAGDRVRGAFDPAGLLVGAP